MATYSRHHANYATPTRTLPITMPTKAPAYHTPTSRVAISPPEYSSSSSRHSKSSSGGSYSVSSRGSDRGSTHGSSRGYGGGRDEEYEVQGSRHGASARGGGGGRVEADPVEMLTERMDRVSDFSTMDRATVRQAQDSGRMNAASAELAQLQALAQRRLKTARVNFAQGVEDAAEARRDLEYCRGKSDAMSRKAERKHPVEFAAAKTKSRSRHAA